MTRRHNAPNDTSTLKPDGVASHLVVAGIAEIEAASELLKGEPSQRSTTRALSEAARGIELVIKGLVATEHWSLVFDEPSKATIRALATDFKSASVEACLDRLEHLAGLKIKKGSRERLQEMRKRRNAYEHFGQLDNVQALRGATGVALHELVTLLADAEDKDLVPKESEGSSGKLAIALMDFDRFTSARMNEIKPTLDGYHVFECPKCLQMTGTIEQGLDCRFCRGHSTAEVAAEHHISSVMRISKYGVIQDGRYWPLFVCVACDSNTLVELEPSSEGDPDFICFECATTFDAAELRRCEACEQFVLAKDEQGLCSDCARAYLDRD